MKKSKYVGVSPVFAHTSKARQNKGITLIALVITIIVMLILVAVTISMAINGGLFDYAGKAVGETKNAINKEQDLANGGIKIGDTYYTIDEYLEYIKENNGNGIKLTYTVKPSEDNLSAVITVKARMTGVIEGYQYYREWALEKLEGKTEEEIEQIFVEGNNYWNEINDWGEPTYANIEELMEYWLTNYGGEYEDVDGMVTDYGYETLIDFAIDWWYVYPEEYEYFDYIEEFQLNMMDPEGNVYYDISTVEYTVYGDGEYTFAVTDGTGTKSNSIVVKIDIFGYIVGVNGEKFSAIYTETKTYTDKNGDTAIIPKGFAVGTSEGIDIIDTGLVIRDVNGNEFVWIPVTEDLGSSYSYSSNYSEPKELTSTYSGSSAAYDSQTTLDYLYGTNYYNYEEDFKYAEEYAEMVKQVNEYDGFYTGRYETTIDYAGNIGSKYNTTVLTSGTTYTNNSTTYYYKWYGLYYAQKNANVTGNGIDIQTAMIYGVLYDKVMDFIRTQKAAGNTTYDVDTVTSSWHRKEMNMEKSGQLNPGVTGDVALNIWDLESNAYEWTQEGNRDGFRVFRGGRIDADWEASLRGTLYGNPATDIILNCSSRIALYLK